MGGCKARSWYVLCHSVDVSPDAGALRVIGILNDRVTDLGEEIGACVFIQRATYWAADAHQEVVAL